MNNQHLPSRVRTRRVADARRCFKKRRTRPSHPLAPIPPIDASPVRVVVAITQRQMSNDYTVYPYRKRTCKNDSKINPFFFTTPPTRTNERTFDGRNIHARPDGDDGDDDDDGRYRVVSRTRRVPSASSEWWDARRSGGASLSSVEGTTERGRARREGDDADDDGVGVGVAKFWWIGRW